MHRQHRSGVITVFLADDNLIVREGVRALLNREDDIESSASPPIGTSSWAGAEAAARQVLVTDIRMPPSFQREGIDAARKRHPGRGVVVLSQDDDPEYVTFSVSGALELRNGAVGRVRGGSGGAVRFDVGDEPVHLGDLSALGLYDLDSEARTPGRPGAGISRS